MFYKIGVLENFASFTGKRLCWSLFLIKLQAFVWKIEFFHKYDYVIFKKSYKTRYSTLTFSLRVTRCAGHNTDLSSNSNISKTVRVNITFARTVFKEYSISFLVILRLITLQLWFFSYGRLRFVELWETQTEFFSFSSTKRVNVRRSSKPYWSLLKIFLKNKKIPITSNLFHENESVTYFKEKAELFNAFFC